MVHPLSHDKHQAIQNPHLPFINGPPGLSFDPAYTADGWGAVSQEYAGELSAEGQPCGTEQSESLCVLGGGDGVGGETDGEGGAEVGDRD